MTEIEAPPLNYIFARPGFGWTDRAGRARFIAQFFASYLRGSVLDVGCGDALLRQHLPNYTGCDIGGKPDVMIDLDRASTLPFADRTFASVVCTDVLEHVEPLRAVFCDLFRVAQHHVIISLPNMYALGFRLRFLTGRVLSKEYSLEPRNRHKWLPAFSETRTMMLKWLPPGWTLTQDYAYYPQAWWRQGKIYESCSRAFPNLLAHTYWALFTRTTA